MEPTGDGGSASADRVLDADGKVALPGLIDAHRHTDFALVQELFSEFGGSELLLVDVDSPRFRPYSNLSTG